MRHRKWVVVLAILIIAGLPLAFLGLKVASRHPAIKRAVLSRVMPEVGGDVTIGELEMGLTSLSVSDVLIDFGDGSYVLVPEATANLSLPKLIAAGLTPERSLSTIIISDPEIMIAFGHEAPEEESEESEVRRPEGFDVASLESYMPDYLGISGAKVSFRDVRTGRTLTVDSIDLLLEREEDGPVSGGASGDCLGGEDNLVARFTWDGAVRQLSLEGALTDARLNEQLPIPPSVAAEMLSGTMSATFHASASPDSIQGMAASFEVTGGAVELTAFAELLEDVNASGRLEGGVLSLSSATGAWRGSLWSASGEVASEGGALRDVRFSASDMPLSPLADLLELDELGIAGSVDVSAGIEGSLDSPVVDVALAGGDVRAGNVELEDVAGSARLTRESVRLDELAAGFFGGAVSVRGTLERESSSGEWRFSVAADARDLDVHRLVEATTGDTTAAGTLSLTGLVGDGTLTDPRLESLIGWEGLSIGPVSPGAGAGGFILSDGNLSASAGSSDRAYSIACHVERLFEAPHVSAEIVLEGLEVDTLLPALEGAVPTVALTGSLSAEGPADSLAVGGRILLESGDAAATIDVDGDLTRMDEREGGGLQLAVASSDAALRGVPVPFTARFSVDQSSLRLDDLRVGRHAELDARVGLDEDRELSAGIVVSEANLREVLVAATGSAPGGLQGLLFASVSVGGTLDEPSATGVVSVGAAEFAGVTNLDASVVAAFEDGVAKLEEFVLRESGNVVVEARGQAEIGGDVELAVTGEGVPGPMLGGAAGTRFDATMGIGGTTDAPTFDGTLTADGGEFLGVPFDAYSARLTAGDGVARLDPLILEREGQYRAKLVGSVPFGALRGEAGSPDGTLTLEVDGNPLAFLAEFTGVAECGPGRGTLSAVLVGSRAGVTAASGRLEAQAERVWPAALFERIDDVSASVSVLDGAVVSGEATGSIDGSELRIRSVRNRVADGRELPTLTAGGVDMGIFAISTDERGVTTNVPGLMLPDEYGRIAVRGKEGEPELLAAGPFARAFLWGEIEFSDLSLTYPFILSEEEDAPEEDPSDGRDIGEFLSDSEWSVRMTAGRNLWYWRPDVNVNIERGSSLDIVGVPAEHSICVSGRAVSTKGTLIYLHTEFDVREVSVDFPSFCEQPRFHVDAETRVADGTVIGLSVHTSEGVPSLTASGTTLDESELVLTSDSPDDNTPEKIMSKLQYGVSYDLLEAEEQASMERRRAVELLGTQIGLRVARPLLAPIESRIRRNLNLDLVRIDVDFVEHFLMQLDLWAAAEGTAPYVPFTANTRMTLGKYITRDWMFSYLGVVEQYEQEIGESALGLRSEVGIEYEVSRNTSLSLRVVYDPTLAGWDRRLSIENRYEF